MDQQLLGILPWIGIFVLFYFMMIRPQQKREKNRQKMISELKAGDRILLLSGIYARVVKTGETVFTVDLGRGVNVEIERNAIANKVDAAESSAA